MLGTVVVHPGSSDEKTKQEVSFFQALPPEFLLAVFRYLTPAELFKMRLVSRDIYTISQDLLFWRKAIPLQIGESVESRKTAQQKQILASLVTKVPDEVNYYYSRNVESLIHVKRVNPDQVKALSALLAEMKKQAITSFDSNFDILLALLELIKQINTLLGRIQITGMPDMKDGISVQYLTRLTPQFIEEARTLLGEKTKELTFSGSPKNLCLLRDNWPVDVNASFFTKPKSTTFTNISANLARANLAQANLARGRQQKTAAQDIEAKRLAEINSQKETEILRASRKAQREEFNPIAEFLAQDSTAENSSAEVSPVLNSSPLPESPSSPPLQRITFRRLRR